MDIFETKVKTPPDSPPITVVDPDDQPMWSSTRNVILTPSSAIIQFPISSFFHIKGTHMQMIQDNQIYGQIPSNPHQHVADFLEISNLFQYGKNQEEAVMLRTFPFSLLGEDDLTQGILDDEGIFLHNTLNEAIKILEDKEVILFYIGLDVPTRQILDSKGVMPTKTAADAKVSIQEMVEYSQKWHNGTSRTRSTETSNGLAAIQAQLNNLGREIKKVNKKVYAAQVGCEQCKGPHYTKDFPLKEEGKTLEEAYFTQFGAPFQGAGYRAAASGFYQRNNENPS
ncbi:hypothetical protein Tco_0445903 [Tanacetum coccineum]